jgi:predicted dehydrogenase
MATTRSTSTQRGQKINACCISALHGNCSPSDKEEDDHARGHLFYFSLSSFPAFHLFTTNVTRALSLKAIKGKAGATSKENKNNTHTHSSLRHRHTRTTPQKRPGICSLSRKLVTPTTSISVQDNTSNSKIYWT